MPDGGIDDPVAVELLAQPKRKRLPGWIADSRIRLERGFGGVVSRAEIMKWPEEVRDQLGVVGHILEASNGFKLAGQVVGHLAETGFRTQRAIPRATIIAIESVTARSRVWIGEGSRSRSTSQDADLVDIAGVTKWRRFTSFHTGGTSHQTYRAAVAGILGRMIRERNRKDSCRPTVSQWP